MGKDSWLSPSLIHAILHIQIYSDLLENNGGKHMRPCLNFILNHEKGFYLQIEKICIKRKLWTSFKKNPF